MIRPDLAAITGFLPRRPFRQSEKISFVVLSDICSVGIPAQRCVRHQCNVSSVGTPVHLRRSDAGGHDACCRIQFSHETGFGESGYLRSQNLGNEERYPEGLLNFESLTLEGCK